MPNDNGIQTAVAQQARDRKHSVTKDDYASGSINFIIPTYGAWGNSQAFAALPERLPAYNRYTFFTRRDTTLMATPHYEAMWADSLAIATTQVAAWAWEVESLIPLRRKRTQLLLNNATAGVFVGWVPFISAHLRSFLLTGKAVVEIERETTAYSSRITGLHHLNPLRCQFTDDPKTPILYYDRNGKVHELEYWQVMLFGDMPDPTLGEYALVQSAAERAYDQITLTAGISRYVYEKVTGKRALALHFLQGITETHLRDAITSTESEQDRHGAMIYKGAAVIPIPGDIEVQLVTIPLAEIPDGFDAQNLRDNAYIIYANSMGLDVNDVDPRLAARTSLGSGAQSLVLQQKSKGRGLAAWKRMWTHNVNQWIADATTTFHFTAESLDDDLKEADLRGKRVATNKARIDSGIITADQARNLEVDAGDLPREFLDTDVTGGGTLGDDEKMTEEAPEAVKPDTAVPVPQPEPERPKTKALDLLELDAGESETAEKAAPSPDPIDKRTGELIAQELPNARRLVADNPNISQA